MVRGLDYYTRTAFEIIHDELGRSKAVGGGGRYDNLLAEIGGPDVSGIGFAIGLERLALGLSNDDAFSKNLDVFVATLGEKTQSQGVVLVNELRRAGLAVETRYQRASLKSQMKTADKYRARYVLMLGDDELARNEVTVRNMQTKDQVSISLDDVISYLQGEDS
jgi:histidyl-tRNA synthetase